MIHRLWMLMWTTLDTGLDRASLLLVHGEHVGCSCWKSPGEPMAEEVLDLEAVWIRAIADLDDDVLPAQHRAWMRLTKPLALVQDTAVLATPNDFAREVLDTKLRPVIMDALSRQLGRDVRVAVTVEAESDSSAAAHVVEPDPEPLVEPPPPPVLGRPGSRESSRLNPKYQFDTFVIGSSNRFAHAAA